MAAAATAPVSRTTTKSPAGSSGWCAWVFSGEPRGRPGLQAARRGPRAPTARQAAPAQRARRAARGRLAARLGPRATPGCLACQGRTGSRGSREHPSKATPGHQVSQVCVCVCVCVCACVCARACVVALKQYNQPTHAYSADVGVSCRRQSTQSLTCCDAIALLAHTQASTAPTAPPVQTAPRAHQVRPTAAAATQQRQHARRHARATTRQPAARGAADTLAACVRADERALARRCRAGAHPCMRAGWCARARAGLPGGPGPAGPPGPPGPAGPPGSGAAVCVSLPRGRVLRAARACAHPGPQTHTHTHTHAHTHTHTHTHTRTHTRARAP
jgi:hypothetical protein